jgi:hypothetical protein
MTRPAWSTCQMVSAVSLDVLAGDRADDRLGEPLAQPPLGVGVLAGPPVPGGQPAGVQVMLDQVRAGPLHAGRVGLKPGAVRTVRGPVVLLLC